MKTKFIYFFLTQMIINSCAVGQERQQSYTCIFTDVAIKIDGKQHESIWKSIDPIWFIPNEKEKLKAKSWFKITWNSEYLLFYFWLEDKDIQAQMTNRDDHLWLEEVMEIFIDADSNPKTYYEFEWNALNTILDLYVLNPNLNRDVIRQWWNWDCEGLLSAVSVQGTINNSKDNDKGWFLEVAIPFSEIQSAENIPPKNGDIWRFDLTRREGTEENGTLQKSSWLPPSTHFPMSYGKLIFNK
ncbi:carbohydrate-binding family 9-like protein [Flavivirga spongiicola]|uniref:Carbohydrate-binding family 9-like protein n=1 Tax=Flavivirga spongiicola TaxID=421621 RepID=A0ABU7XW92_9FLAO|nr:carbohydrate-binding family 9-like protein [Flavivirga sp. MEBiC05379]MDO5980046.1 carbohydrate-binding family 9-like protein [Flavivirga sp. MEBiC05379]